VSGYHLFVVLLKAGAWIFHPEKMLIRPPNIRLKLFATIEPESFLLEPNYHKMNTSVNSGTLCIVSTAILNDPNSFLRVQYKLFQGPWQLLLWSPFLPVKGLIHIPKIGQGCYTLLPKRIFTRKKDA